MFLLTLLYKCVEDTGAATTNDLKTMFNQSDSFVFNPSMCDVTV